MLPLKGLKVLESTHAVMGPTTGLLLNMVKRVKILRGGTTDQTSCYILTIGEHTVSILRENGYSEKQIQTFLDKNIVKN